jgi:hypothetical protein
MARYNRSAAKKFRSELSLARPVSNDTRNIVRAGALRSASAPGRPLAETVVLTPVPSHQDYSYAVVNNRRVVLLSREPDE